MADKDSTQESVLTQSQNPEFMVDTYRKRLHSTIEMIYKDLKTDSVFDEVPYMLQCIEHMLKLFPQVFAFVSSEDGGIRDKHKQDKICKAFTVWVINKLFMLFNIDRSTPAIITSTEKVIVAIINEIKLRDNDCFIYLLGELLFAANDLTKIDETLLKSKKSIQSLKRFVIFYEYDEDEVDDYKLDIDCLSLAIMNSVQCEIIESSLIKIWNRLLPTVSSLMMQKYRDILWGIFSWHLEKSNLQLKKAVLDAIATALVCIGVPVDLQVQEYFVCCFVSLIKWVFGCFSKIGQATPELLESLANCMEILFTEDILPFLDVQFSLHITETMIEVLKTKGFNDIGSEKLRDAFVNAVIAGITLPEWKSIQKEILRSQLCSTILDKICKEGHVKGYNKLLLGSVQEEVSTLEALMSKRTSTSTSSSSHYGSTFTSDEAAKDEIAEKYAIFNITSLAASDISIQPTEDAVEILANSNLAKLHETFENEVKSFQTQVSQKILIKPLDLERLQTLTEVAVLCYVFFKKSLEQETHAIDIEDMPAFQCFSYELMNDVCSCFGEILLKWCTDKKSNTNLKKSFSSMISILGSFIFAQNKTNLTKQSLNIICTLASTHWFSIMKSEADLRSEHNVSLIEHIKQLNVTLSNEDISVCLRILSLLPADISPQWRVKVFKHAVNCEEVGMCTMALECIPFLLHNLSDKRTDLSKLFYSMMNSQDPTIQLTCSKAISHFTCVLADKTEIFRTSGMSADFWFILNNIQLRCDECEMTPESIAKKYGKTSDFDSITQPIPHYAKAAENMLNLIDNAKETNIKLTIVKSLKSVFIHSPPRGNLLPACINFVEDSSSSVRNALSCVIAYYITTPFGIPSSSEDVLVSRLQTAFVKAVDTENIHVQHSILETIGQIARYSKPNLLLVMMLSLIENLASRNVIITATSWTQLRNIAKARSVTMQNLFQQFKQPICKFILEWIHKFQKNRETDVMEFLRTVAEAFEFSTLDSFFLVSMRFMLPCLITKSTPQASAILKQLATLQNTNRRKLILNNFKYIFTHLVCICSRSEMESALAYVQKETEIELGSLLRCDFQHIQNELLLKISSHYNQVLSGMTMLASSDEQQEGVKRIETSQQMAEFLRPRLLGFLAFFDSLLLNANVSMDEKFNVLKSLIAVIKIMGHKNITPIRMKVMATLKNSLKFEDDSVINVVCEAWMTFVQNVDVTVLGPMLSLIIVTLIPVLEKNPQEVSKVFRFLILDNRDQLKEYFHDLYLLPQLPELIEINKFAREWLTKSCNEEQFCLLLTQSFKSISHENSDVRFQALSKLKEFLWKNKETLNNVMSKAETVDPVISQLISTLLSGSRDSNPQTRLVVGECLGEIGAIDPGRLKFASLSHASNNIHCNVDDEDFAYDLIQEVTRSFIAAEDTRIQDCASYAIQELLQIYGCKTTKPNELPDTSLWKRFPADTQQILSPLLHSKYMINIPIQHSEFPKPIFESRKGYTFKTWVCSWTTFLITMVKNEKAIKVFAANSMIIKHDTSVALYLLPFTLLYALLDGSENDRDEIVNEILAVLSYKEEKSVQGSESDLHHMSTQIIFSILNYLHKFLRKISEPKSSESKSKVKSTILNFLSNIPQDILARASHHCQAYTRALMHLECYIKSHPESVQSNLAFLQKLYIALEEVDGVAGVETLRLEEPKFNEKILLHESTGQLQDAFSCYEKAIHSEPNNVLLYQGMMRCLMGLDQPNTALAYSTGVLSTKPEWTNALNQYRIESAWKLGDWEGLETFLKPKEVSYCFGASIGKILHLAKSKDTEECQQFLDRIREDQMAPLSAASMEKCAYQRGYEYLVRLHVISELEQGIKMFTGWSPTSCTFSMDEQLSPLDVVKQWDSRIRLVQQSLKPLEPILNVRRTILCLVRENRPHLAKLLNYQIGSSWLLSAKVARKSGHLQQAYSSLLDASRYSLVEVFVEKAKWFWAKGEQEQAIVSLQKGLQEHYSEIMLQSKPDMMAKSTRLSCAKAKLLLARYSDESANLESLSVIKMYREVQEMCQEWEDGHFYLAQYLDRILISFSEQGTRDKKLDFMMNIIKNYGQSLHYGSQYIYHSMPRMLSLWLDFGTQVANATKRRDSTSALIEHLTRSLNVIHTKFISTYTAQLQPYQFMTAFPQLISRICHSHKEVFLHLKEIIAQLLVKYPQQAMWMLMAVSKSSYAMRVSRCLEIFNQATTMKPELHKFIQDSTKFTDRLLELCNKHVEGAGNRISSHTHFRSLIRLLEDRNFSSIMLPLQPLMTVWLPSKTGEQGDKHDPFPYTPVYIQGLLDTVEILPSLQKPKKITMRGSDGKLYIMMAKPKDDLRKDCRLMEFNRLVNKSLLHDAESRKRELLIRTYAVVPLNEECGLLEWVPNLRGLRPILLELYKQKNLGLGRELGRYVVPPNAPFEVKMNTFKQKLLPVYPSVFDEWFLFNFTDPTDWYSARLAYVRTTAVMSIVGYIVGLGDRHGENILVDSSCGESVHVDLNCLFNKGETFETPERVPFRLTHNMVTAMGPTGYEGVYRKSCEVTLRVMRKQMGTLMSVLKPFIHDPLVEWSKTSRNPKSIDSGEIVNEKAVTHVQDIECRLKGVVKNKKTQGLPLSVEGQVNYLIQEATSDKNLCQMYIGWAPYL